MHILSIKKEIVVSFSESRRIKLISIYNSLNDTKSNDNLVLVSNDKKKLSFKDGTAIMFRLDYTEDKKVGSLQKEFRTGRWRYYEHKKPEEALNNEKEDYKLLKQCLLNYAKLLKDCASCPVLLEEPENRKKLAAYKGFFNAPNTLALISKKAELSDKVKFLNELNDEFQEMRRTVDKGLPDFERNYTSFKSIIKEVDTLSVNQLNKLSECCETLRNSCTSLKSKCFDLQMMDKERSLTVYNNYLMKQEIMLASKLKAPTVKSKVAVGGPATGMAHKQDENNQVTLASGGWRGLLNAGKKCLGLDTDSSSNDH